MKCQGKTTQPLIIFLVLYFVMIKYNTHSNLAPILRIYYNWYIWYSEIFNIVNKKGLEDFFTITMFQCTNYLPIYIVCMIFIPEILYWDNLEDEKFHPTNRRMWSRTRRKGLRSIQEKYLYISYTSRKKSNCDV